MDKDQTEQLIAEIRQRVPLTNYLQKSKKGNYICPFCGSGEKASKTGALKIYPDTNTFHCFAAGCEKTGDVIDVYQQENGVDFNEALRSLAAEAGLQYDDSIPAERPGRTKKSSAADPSSDKDKPDSEGPKPVDYTEYYRECMERLTDPKASSYLSERGISEATAKAYWIGYDPEADPVFAPGGKGEKKHPVERIILPTTRRHYVARAIDPDTEAAYKKMNPKGSTPGIFNSNALYAQEVSVVFVTEGIFDALSIIEAGAAAVATNSANNVGKLVDGLRKKPTRVTLAICLDNDPDENTRKAVEKERQSLENGLTEIGVRFVEVDVCGPYKDPNEYLQKDREAFIKAVQEAQEVARPKSEMELFLSETAGDRYKPIPTGVRELDRLLKGGFLPATLVTIGAPPGSGKSALAMTIFENMAATGSTGIYFNMEMSKSQLYARSIARRVYEKDHSHQLTALDVLRGYSQSEVTKQLIKEAATEYQEEVLNRLIYNPDVHRDNPNDVDAILNYLEGVGDRAKLHGRPAPNICIDYLQLMTGQPHEDASEVIKRAVGGLKRYAIKYNAIVVCIVAQNRAANNSKEATMSAGRDSSSIEYSSDLQLQLIPDDPEDGTETVMDNRLIKLHVTKSRFSPITSKFGICFTFHGGQAYFEEAETWETYTENSKKKPQQSQPAKKAKRKTKKELEAEQIEGQQELPF